VLQCVAVCCSVVCCSDGDNVRWCVWEGEQGVACERCVAGESVRGVCGSANARECVRTVCIIVERVCAVCAEV